MSDEYATVNFNFQSEDDAKKAYDYLENKYSNCCDLYLEGKTISSQGEDNEDGYPACLETEDGESVTLKTYYDLEKSGIIKELKKLGLSFEYDIFSDFRVAWESNDWGSLAGYSSLEKSSPYGYKRPPAEYWEGAEYPTDDAYYQIYTNDIDYPPYIKCDFDDKYLLLKNKKTGQTIEGPCAQVIRVSQEDKYDMFLSSREDSEDDIDEDMMAEYEEEYLDSSGWKENDFCYAKFCYTLPYCHEPDLEKQGQELIAKCLISYFHHEDIINKFLEEQRGNYLYEDADFETAERELSFYCADCADEDECKYIDEIYAKPETWKFNIDDWEIAH